MNEVLVQAPAATDKPQCDHRLAESALEGGSLELNSCAIPTESCAIVARKPIAQENLPSGDHPVSEFKAKAREVVCGWGISDAVAMGLAADIVTALAEAYGEGLVQAQQKPGGPQCDHPDAEFVDQIVGRLHCTASCAEELTSALKWNRAIIAKALAEAVAAEREACAKIAVGAYHLMVPPPRGGRIYVQNAGHCVAAYIRSRSRGDVK